MYVSLIEILENINLLSKCIAFFENHCNTNFDGLDRRGTNNVFYRLNQHIKRPIIRVGCSAHILNNCVRMHAISGLLMDIKSIILKIYNYFLMFFNNSLHFFLNKNLSVLIFKL